MPASMPSSPSQAATPDSVSPDSIPKDQAVHNNPAPPSLTLQVQRQFADFRDRHPHSSLTAVLESGPAVNSADMLEYVVRATISLEGRPLVSSLAAAPTVEEAEDLARLRNLALAEAVVRQSSDAPMARGNSSSISMSSPPQSSAMSTPMAVQAQNQMVQGQVAQDQMAPNQMDYGGDDGLGDTMINLGALAPEELAPTSPNQSSKPKPKAKAKPKPKRKAKPSAIAASNIAAPAAAESPNEPLVEKTEAVDEFVADWSEDLAQISVELKRLNWDSQQEQDYLQRTFNKSSRDDIIDHRELMDYLGYLQALPSQAEDSTEEGDSSPIADRGLSVDEADLAPQSVSELIASAGLKSASELPTPPPAVAVATSMTEAEVPETATETIAQTTDSSAEDTIIREPEPEIEIDDGESEISAPQLNGPESDAPASDSPEADGSAPYGSAPDISAPNSSDNPVPAENLNRSEMMEETARLCKQLGWKNRQGSDFLQATYNKPTRKDLTDAEMMDFLEQLRSLSTTEALPY